MPAFGDAYSDAGDHRRRHQLCHGAVRRGEFAPNGGERRRASAYPVTGELAVHHPRVWLEFRDDPPDGSLTICVQKDAPEADKMSNSLPAPEGNFPACWSDIDSSASLM